MNNKLDQGISYYKKFLESVGEDMNREGLLETPKRHTKFISEFRNPKEFNLTVFNSENMDEMIIQKNIPFYSLCEHHVVPFFGEAFIAYIPNEKIVGLSKLARTVDFFSRKLQNQERITTEIAEFLKEKLKCENIAVVLEARHLCMEMRGVQKPGTKTITSKMLGVFKEISSDARKEFLTLIK